MSVPALSQLLGQPEVSAFLRGVVSRGRYGNAYLFHGPAGVGKGTAALAFARAALCEHVPGAAPASRPAEASLFGDAPPPATGDDACGACPACGKAAQLQHPDLKFLFPVMAPRADEGKGRKDDEDLMAEVLAAWREDPLYAFQYDRFASIRVGMTKDLQRELAYHPYEAARRVVVIRDCDRMREDQYSTLLKAVEEPGATTVWVLTTARATRVPATIRSRCQRVRFAPLGEAVIREFLSTRAGVADEKSARALAALAAGSLTRALALRDQDIVRLRDQALDLLGTAAGGEGRAETPLVLAVQKYMNFGRTTREDQRRTLEFLMLWLRDLLRMRYGAPREALVNRDKEPELRRLAATIDATEVRRRLMVLEEALRAIEGNVSPDLTLASSLLRASGRRMGEGAWPGHATARWDY